MYNFFMDDYRDNPIAFMKAVMGEFTLLPWQEEILNSKYHKISMVSGMRHSKWYFTLISLREDWIRGESTVMFSLPIERVARPHIIFDDPFMGDVT